VGVPVHDDRHLFEMLILEGAQAGLSWITILRKREAYRKAFDGFDARKIADYKSPTLRELMKDAGIVRNRLKIEGTVKNAKRESDAMSKALKKRGFTFVGSTICYAFMQATGMVNDHVVGCVARRR
jgi:DNA-3-methyladenine glycosylase I